MHLLVSSTGFFPRNFNQPPFMSFQYAQIRRINDAPQNAVIKKNWINFITIPIIRKPEITDPNKKT